MHIQSITPKQIEILIHLYKFRFLNRHQIQTLLHHKDHHLINAWLNNLVKDELINRISKRTFEENSKPSIYYLSNKSKLILKKNLILKGQDLKHINREKERSDTFVSHCLLVADVYIHLLYNFEGKVHFFTKNVLLNHAYLLRPRPDAYIALELENTIKRFFLEIVDDNVPRYAIRFRVKNYYNYAESKDWEKYTKHAFPKIVFVSQSQRIQKYLQKYLSQAMSEELESLTLISIFSKELNRLHQVL